MELKSSLKEFSIILFAAIILGACYSYPGNSSQIITFTIFLFIIIGVNILAKKFAAYDFELNVETKFWSIYHYGLKQGAHFVKPVYMIWLPILLSLISRGLLFWMPILEFDITALPERVSRRHGLYRFAQATEWHIALIIMWGIISSLALAIIGYFLGFNLFSRLCVYYAIWNIIPISGLDGSKLFFGSRHLWVAVAIVVIIFLIFGLSIV
jgi:hypothetical protein